LSNRLKQHPSTGNVDSGLPVIVYGIPTLFLPERNKKLCYSKLLCSIKKEILEKMCEVQRVNLDVNPLSEALLLWADVPTDLGAGPPTS
jgi:hypothetical protein